MEILIVVLLSMLVSGLVFFLLSRWQSDFCTP
jgi:hypothetical protein